MGIESVEHMRLKPRKERSNDGRCHGNGNEITRSIGLCLTIIQSDRAFQ